MPARSYVTWANQLIGAIAPEHSVTLRAPQTGWISMSDDDLDEELELEEPIEPDAEPFGDGEDVDLDADFELDEELLEVGDLEDDIDPDLDDELVIGEELESDVDIEVAADEAPAMPEAPGAADEEEEEDLTDPDDVEASLDDILKDRLVIEDDGPDDDDDETPDLDDRGEGASVVIPRRPDEFVCQSCFLVKHVSQIADDAKQLCRDCV